MSRKTIRDHEGLGVTVTLARRDDTDETRIVHVAHKSRREALRRAVAPFDPAGWRVVTVSTPASIYADLTHSRELREPRAHISDTSSAPTYSVGGVMLPEPYLLSGAGLKAYL